MGRAATKFDAATILDESALSLEEARTYCRRLATSHYENFLVGSLFVPRSLRQHFYNIYAYCRISDDLGDECPDPQLALQNLDQWEDMLKACYSGQVRHPVFVALHETIGQYEIPIHPFADLLKAFRLDQTKNRYRTYQELLEYCRYSANPVGRLVLYLGGYRDAERQELSDCTCTALQLANHWQDIAVDLRNLNRIYIPAEDLEQCRYSEEELKAHTCNESFRNVMKIEINRARELFLKGRALSHLVDSRLSREIMMFNQAGLEVLRRIEAAQYDIFRRRPEIGKGTALWILLQTLWKH